MPRRSRFPAQRRSTTLLPLVLVMLTGLVLFALPTLSQDLSGPGGARLSASDLASGQHVLVFFASWSPKCRDIGPRTRAIADRFSGRARVHLVNFQEDAATAQQFLGGSAGAVPLLVDRDGSFARRHSVLNLPGLVVYKNGEAVYSGTLPGDAESLIDSLLD